LADETDSTGGEQGSQEAGPSECMPCGGRGRVISRLGGEEHEVQCPWCGGSGVRSSGMDAQAEWLAKRGQSPEEPASEPEPEPPAAA
jgi:hypothetical protein